MNDVALKNEILRGIVGSEAHGTAKPGLTDRDEMGIFIQPPAYVIGLREYDNYIYRDQPDGVRSQPGDLDLTLYGLKKFCGLAAAGNPSLLMLLYLPSYLKCVGPASLLVQMRADFISRNAGQRYLGYLIAQKQKMLGLRAHTVNRPDLVEAHGYDTKFAMHALRLGLQGHELLTTRHMQLPVAEPWLSTLRAIRFGQVPEADALRMIEESEERLKAAIDDCELQTNYDKINRFLIEAHLEHWDA